MTRTTRNVTVALTAAAILIGAGSRDAHGESTSGNTEEATLVLHLINYASLPSGVLDIAKARVELVFGRARVTIVWIDNKEAVARHDGASLHLTVLLLPRDMAEKKISADRIEDGVLAQAHPVAGRASIFCDRIATAAGAANHFGISLGDVIGHEVGHLVLGTNSHSRSGIMRANMDVGAFRFRTFEQTQATAIRTSLLGLATSSARR